MAVFLIWITACKIEPCSHETAIKSGASQRASALQVMFEDLDRHLLQRRLQCVSKQVICSNPSSFQTSTAYESNTPLALGRAIMALTVQ